MNFSHWIKQILGQRKQQTYQHLRQKKSYKPSLEVFEDRVVPAVIIDPANLTVNNLAFHSETIVIDEHDHNDNDIPTVNGSKTIEISAPPGWEFNTAGGFSVGHKSGEDITGASITATNSKLTVTVKSDDSSPDNDDDRLTINFQVRATSVASSNGHLHRTGGSLGAISGLTNNSTSLGLLKLAEGVAVTPAPNGTNLIDTDSANLGNHAIGDIVITEALSNPNGINGVNNGTRSITLQTPAGWAFNTAVLPTILREQVPSGDGDLNNGSNSVTPPSVTFLDDTHVKITFHFDSNADNERDRVIIRGLQVHALSADAAPGNITRCDCDLFIFGVIPGVTSFGALSLNPIENVAVTPASLVVNDLNFHDIGPIKLREVNGPHGFNFTTSGPKTLTLNAPAGWVFDIDGDAPQLSITSKESIHNNDFKSLAGPLNYSFSHNADGTSITLTLEFDGNPESETDYLVISGIRAKATSGTSAPGNILRDPASTLSIDGVGNSTVLGTLERAPSHVAQVNVHSGSHQGATVDHKFGNQLAVEVRDQFGNLMPDGTKVTFKAPGHGASGKFSNGCDTITVETCNGIASVGFWANTKAGKYDVEVCVDGVETKICGLENHPDCPAKIEWESGEHQGTTVDHKFKDELKVKVTDKWGNVVKDGTKVTFKAPDHGPSGKFKNDCDTITVETCNGYASVEFWANTKAGDYDVKVCVDGVETTTCKLENYPDCPAKIEWESGEHQATTVDHKFNDELKVKVTDKWGNVVKDGTKVTFKAPDHGPSGKFSNGCDTITVETCNGYASVPIWANTKAGEYDVKVCVDGVETTTCKLENNPDVAAHVAWESGGAQSTTVDHKFSDELKVKVTDKWGNLVKDGTKVTFKTPSHGPSGKFSNGCETITVETCNGFASVGLWANRKAGDYKVEVCVAGAEAAIGTMDNEPDVAKNVKVIRGKDQSTTVDTEFDDKLKVKVTDKWGNAVADGTKVTFKAPDCGPSGTFSNGCDTITVETKNGYASVTFKANTKAGEYDVEVCVEGTKGAKICNLVNKPGAAKFVTVINGKSQDTKVGTKFDDRLTVKVTDKFGNAVKDGTKVTFKAPDDGASGTFRNGRDTITVETHNGIASVRFKANTKAGEYDVKVYVKGTKGATIFNLENNPGRAKNVVVIDGKNQETKVGTKFDDKLTVKVTDKFGNPVKDGTKVTFKAPDDGPSGTFRNGRDTITVETRDGIASVRFKANNKAGEYDVKVYVKGTDGATICRLENKADAAAKLVFVSQPSSSVYAGSNLGTIGVELLDVHGNAVREAGRLVTITIPTLPGVSFKAYTDASGKATFSDIVVNKWNTSSNPHYKLEASSGDLDEALSDPFEVKFKHTWHHRR